MSNEPLWSLSKQSKRDFNYRSCSSEIYIFLTYMDVQTNFRFSTILIIPKPYKMYNIHSIRQLKLSHSIKTVHYLSFPIIFFLFASLDLMSFKGKNNQKIYISSQGLKQILEKPKDTQYPLKGVVWTDDFKCELPIRIGADGPESYQPQTLIDMFYRCVKNYPTRPALSVKRNQKWETLTYEQYAQQCQIFGRALIALGIQEFTSLNIIGFNSPQWNIAFFGSIFARCLPTGVYTTNSIKSCQYLAQHSECRIIVAQNYQLAQKYMNLLQKGEIMLIILYNDPNYKIPSKYQRKIFHWNHFMVQGHRVQIRYLQQRMQKVRPGNCCTLVYTSGTTGMPKGVMISHDSYTWTKKAMNNIYKREQEKDQLRFVSYLPLSHVAAQFSDLVSPLDEGAHVYFADPTALQGTLIQTLQQVRPTVFFSVPRVWEKIYDKMQQIARSNGPLKTKIATWAKQLGPQGTIKDYLHEETSLGYKLAKILIFNNVKKALGLDKCQFFFFGAAPMDPKIRQYFLSLNIFLINGYGMSQSTGPQNFSDIYTFDYKKLNVFKQVGKKLPGTQEKIVPLTQQNKKHGEGEICYKGRNVFMGYFKNPEETNKSIDAEGFLHSGDMGKLDKNGVLFITGRAKQLIITAGGQNIPPLLIEQEIMAVLPFISQVMVVGQRRKFLMCLIAIKESAPGSGKIQSSARHYLGLKGAQLDTIEQARHSKIVNHLISAGLKQANEKAISRAQIVQNYFIMPEEFSVQNGLLTPTLKLKRKDAQKKYLKQIQQIYMRAKL